MSKHIEWLFIHSIVLSLSHEKDKKDGFGTGSNEKRGQLPECLPDHLQIKGTGRQVAGFCFT